MNTRFKKWAGVVGAALVGVLAFSAISFAQTPDTSSSTPLLERIQQGFQSGFERGGPGGRGGHGGPGGFGEMRGEKDADLAEALGMTEAELRAAIQGGQTIEEIAAEKGVDLPAFFLAQAKERLDAAVADGKMTQAEADAKLAEIQTAIENGDFPGRHGFGEMRGEKDADLAEALGMTAAELRTAIQNGQTIEEIAAEKGVDLPAFFLAQAKERLDAAVADGKMTQAEADAKLAEIQTAIENGDFPGPRGPHGERGGHGPRGRGGPRGGQNGTPFNGPANPNL